MKDEYIPIGYTKKTYGARGELKIVIEDRYLEDFAGSEVVFINVQGKPAPFFVEDIRDTGDLILKLEDIDDPTQAKALTSSEMFLRRQDLTASSDAVATNSFKIYEGYEIEDEQFGRIGKIIEVVEYPQQELAVVAHGGREIMIPLHADLLKKVDQNKRVLWLQLPEGILDL